jgi:hypothetical protein
MVLVSRGLMRNCRCVCQLHRDRAISVVVHAAEARRRCGMRVRAPSMALDAARSWGLSHGGIGLCVRSRAMHRATGRRATESGKRSTVPQNHYAGRLLRSLQNCTVATWAVMRRRKR